jgi:hypothetical protein
MIATLLRLLLRPLTRLDAWVWGDVDAEISWDQVRADEYDATVANRADHIGRG